MTDFKVLPKIIVLHRFLGLCYPNQMKLTWKSFEDLSTITVDKGMVEDHLPTAVMAGLRRIKKQFIGRHYDPKETERIRNDVHQEYRQRATARRRRKDFGGEYFEGCDDGGSSGLRNGNQRVTTGNEGVKRSEAELGYERGGVQNGTSLQESRVSDSGSQSIQVAVTLEEDIHTHSSGHRPQFEEVKLQESQSYGAAAKASAFLQALGKPQASPVAVQPKELALEMEEML